MRAGDEGTAVGDVYRAEVVGFDLATRLVNETTRGLEIALRFEQRLRRDDDFLAGVGQVARQSDPVGDAQLLPARADDFADVNDVDGLDLRHLGVELEDFLFWPEIEQGA